MAVNENLQGLGAWGLRLGTDTPQEIMDALDYFGHVALHTGEVDPRVAGDALLRSARYVGVYRGKASTADSYALQGPGMAWWLGDEEDKGEGIEVNTIIPAATDFDDAVRSLLPASLSVIEGNLANPPGKAFGGSFQYTTPRRAIDYICQTVGGCGWRVNGDGTLDAGLESDLFIVNPKAAVLRRMSGKDLFLEGFGGAMSTDQDVEDFTTRVVLLASGSEATTVTATADINPALNPYKNLRGNAVKLTRFISESETDPTNAPARAQLQLNRFTGTRDAISLSTEEYDLRGSAAVGDYLWVYDPTIGVWDPANEVEFFGERLYPQKLRLTELSWPVTPGMGVAFRDADGKWFDLSPWYIPESGSTTLVVGGYNRSLGGDGGAIGSRPQVDTSIPAAPTWNTPFLYSVYQSDRGDTLAQVQLRWNQPLNVDGSTILDGDHYEIRYRSSTTPIFPSTHAQMAARTHLQLALGTHEQPIVYPAGPWQTAYAPFDSLSTLLAGLPTNMPYEAQVRAVDAAKPPNAGAWSAVTVFQTSGDTLPPATPAPPLVAASTLAVQITHNLGRADGGSFNLDPDLHHLEVHGEYTPLFTPNVGTLLGKISATYGMMQSGTLVVGTVPLQSVAPVYFKVIAVDNDGNASPASTAVTATALLVDDSQISNLTVSKVTAGTISTTWLVGGTIMAGTPGANRVQLVAAGLEAYSPANVRTVFIEAATGEATLTGKLQSGMAGRRVIINPTATTVPEIWFEATAGSVRHAYINSLGGTGDVWLGLNSGPTSDNGVSGTGFQTTVILGPTFALMGSNVVGMPGGPYGSRAGGWFSADTNTAYIGWNNDSIGVEYHHRINNNGDHFFRGKFANANIDSGNSALVCGNLGFGGGGGFSSFFGYGLTMASNPAVLATVSSGGGTLFRWHVSQRSSTGFWINIEGAAQASIDVAFWAFRH